MKGYERIRDVKAQVEKGRKYRLNGCKPKPGCASENIQEHCLRVYEHWQKISSYARKYVEKNGATRAELKELSGVPADIQRKIIDKAKAGEDLHTLLFGCPEKISYEEKRDTERMKKGRRNAGLNGPPAATLAEKRLKAAVDAFGLMLEDLPWTESLYVESHEHFDKLFKLVKEFEKQYK